MRSGLKTAFGEILLAEPWCRVPTPERARQEDYSQADHQPRRRAGRRNKPPFRPTLPSQRRGRIHRGHARHVAGLRDPRLLVDGPQCKEYSLPGLDRSPHAPSPSRARVTPRWLDSVQRSLAKRLQPPTTPLQLRKPVARRTRAAAGTRTAGARRGSDPSAPRPSSQRPPPAAAGASSRPPR